MRYDALQCARAYLILWKLVDQLFPDSRWLEITEFSNAELKEHGERLLRDSLTWCDKPKALKKSIHKVRQLSRVALAEGVIGQALDLRTQLRDQALAYAEQVRPGTENSLKRPQESC